jgi:hypothetical protein
MSLKVGDKVILENLGLDTLRGEVIEVKTVDFILYTIIKWDSGADLKRLSIVDYRSDQLEFLGVKKDYQSIRQNKLNELGIV